MAVASKNSHLFFLSLLLTLESSNPKPEILNILFPPWAPLNLLFRFSLTLTRLESSGIKTLKIK